MRALCIVLMVFLVGCGPADNLVSVSGTVLNDDKPIQGATVAFVGNNGGTYGTGITDSAGKFSLRAAPGQNKVAIAKDDVPSGPPPSNNPEDQTMGTPEQVAKAMKSAPKPLVAAKFGNPDKSGIVIDVKPGMTPMELKVSSK
jgi:hypothetical protein